MTSLLPIVLLTVAAALGPAAAAEPTRGAAGERGQISGRIELFPDGRVVRAPGRAAASAPRPADGSGHVAAPPVAPLPAGFTEPRFPGARR
ncbi:hypothetical protein [Stella sp.]|uniref:hypothetical protein n=1 Tax=Stella sp. TaxID=2912054 RepID=UPI0035B02230